MQKIPQFAKLVVVVGETASGKSALAMELARRFNGELVCADSWTVYKGFDIGTAKPDATERAEIPHHLLDVADPMVGYSAVEFQRQAKAAIDDIVARGKLPIMVGGTGLYVDSILFDYQFLPAPAKGLRDELDAKALAELQRQVADAGYNTNGIDMQNKRRVIRLIENQGVRPTKAELRPQTLIVGIHTDREHLQQRIERRVDVMMAGGLEDEVRQLSVKYGWDVEPMKGIGYREWQMYVQPNPGVSHTLDEVRQRIVAATVGLAKRQRTWFKRNNWIQWVEAPNTEAQSVDLVTTFLAGDSQS